MTEATPFGLDIAQARQFLFEHRDRLPLFVITDHPSDWPDFYVARLHFSLPEPDASAFVIMDPDLERLQETLEILGLVKLARSPEDDPTILESWI